jgi:hypothetical protein
VSIHGAPDQYIYSTIFGEPTQLQQNAHALRALDVPVSSADVERAFSAYKKLVCPSRLALCDESVRVLHSAAWNGDITGRFEGFEH